VLQGTTRPKPAAEPPQQPTPEPEAQEATLSSPAENGTGPSRAGRGKRRKGQSLEDRQAKKVKGRTIYLPDDLFERLLVQSHRRSMTISDYVAWVLDRQVPDHRGSGNDVA